MAIFLDYDVLSLILNFVLNLKDFLQIECLLRRSNKKNKNNKRTAIGMKLSTNKDISILSFHILSVLHVHDTEKYAFQSNVLFFFKCRVIRFALSLLPSKSSEYYD